MCFLAFDCQGFGHCICFGGGRIGGSGDVGVIGLFFDNIACKKCEVTLNSHGSTEHDGSCARNSANGPAVAETRSIPNLARDVVDPSRMGLPKEIALQIADQACADALRELRGAFDSVVELMHDREEITALMSSVDSVDRTVRTLTATAKSEIGTAKKDDSVSGIVSSLIESTLLAVNDAIRKMNQCLSANGCALVFELVPVHECTETGAPAADDVVLYPAYIACDGDAATSSAFIKAINGTNRDGSSSGGGVSSLYTELDGSPLLIPQVARTPDQAHHVKSVGKAAKKAGLVNTVQLKRMQSSVTRNFKDLKTALQHVEVTRLLNGNTTPLHYRDEDVRGVLVRCVLRMNNIIPHMRNDHSNCDPGVCKETKRYNEILRAVSDSCNGPAREVAWQKAVAEVKKQRLAYMKEHHLQTGYVAEENMWLSCNDEYGKKISVVLERFLKLETCFDISRSINTHINELLWSVATVFSQV